jgi:hypothetical protein
MKCGEIFHETMSNIDDSRIGRFEKNAWKSRDFNAQKQVLTNDSSKRYLEKITFLVSNSCGIYEDIKHFLTGNVQKLKFFHMPFGLFYGYLG